MYTGVVDQNWITYFLVPLDILLELHQNYMRTIKPPSNESYQIESQLSHDLPTSSLIPYMSITPDKTLSQWTQDKTRNLLNWTPNLMEAIDSENLFIPPQALDFNLLQYLQITHFSVLISFITLLTVKCLWMASQTQINIMHKMSYNDFAVNSV